MINLGKKERLRNGEIVELKPGTHGRLNKENRTLELDSGLVLPISKEDQRDLFPENERDLDVARKTEKLQKEVNEHPLGNFAYQFGQRGIAQAPLDWLKYLTMSGEEYLRDKEANRRVSERGFEESPLASYAGVGASFIPDVAITKGMSGAKAGALLPVAHAGSRIATEPGEVAGEAALGAGLGWVIDKGVGALNRIASRRKLNRDISTQKPIIEAENAANKQAVEAANKQAASQYKIDQQNVKNQNAQLMQQHKQDLAARKLLEEQDALLKSQLPLKQQQANAQYSANVIHNIEEVAKKFPKNARITSSDLDIPAFVESAVSKSALAGSTEGAKVVRVLNSLFPEGEALTASELASRYNSIEQIIQKSSPEVQQTLSAFKDYVGYKIPSLLSNQLAYERAVPYLIKQLEKDFKSVHKKIPNDSFFPYKNTSEKVLKEKIKDYLEKLSPNEFIEKVNTGNISEEFLEKMIPRMDFYLDNFNDPINSLRNNIQKTVENAQIKMIGTEQDAAKRLGKKVGETLGLAPELQFTPNPALSQPVAVPNLISQPTPPQTQIFSPKAIPVIPNASGVSERIGDFLEKDLLGGKTIVNNPITKLGALKYLAGKASSPVVAGYLGAKALTSPTSLGEIGRKSFREVGIQAVAQLAEKYPSYHNGILEDPRERRSLTKEIEDDPEIPLGEKAVIQSKINRGKSLFDRLY